MRLSAVGFLMILTTIFLSGCDTQKGQMAALEDKGTSYYGRGGSVLNPSIRSAGTYQDAAVSGVESRDLSSPTTSGSSNMTKPAPMKATGTKSPFMTVAQSNAPYANQTAAVTATPGSWQWPVNGKVIQNFGAQRNGTTSDGISIAAAEGDPIRAAQAGEVAYVGNNIRDYGNIAILRHGDGTLSAYSHARTLTVAKGQKVDAGSVIGFVGHTGSAKTPQLHFAVRQGDKAIDPIGKLPHNVASN